MRSVTLMLLLSAMIAPLTWTMSASAAGSDAEAMTEAVLAFLDELDPAEREALTFPMAAGERVHWSNLPASMEIPDGLMLGDLSDAERRAVYRLLAASMSSQGYGKAVGIIRSDDLLHDIVVAQYSNPQTDRERFMAALAQGYNSGNYGVAVFGDPAAGDWGWQLDGHHLGANFTVTGGRVAFTPLFLGSNPMRVESGPYAGWMPLPAEGRRGLDLLLSLSDEQREVAIIAGETPGDIVAGPGRQRSLERYEGLKASRLTVVQMRMLRSLVGEYVDNGNDDAATALREEIDDADWEELWFSWRGPVDADGVFYYRVHGPRVLIEYSRQDRNHEHTILRDPQNDYGADWLETHYTEVHPTMEEVTRSFSARHGLDDGN